MSHKRGMELRLLHGVAHGKPWFGRWGYQFGLGTYGVTHQIYQEGLEAIQNVPLCLLSHHLTNISHEISMVFSKYQRLSNDPLITLHDFFLFILGLHSRLPKETYTNSQNQIISVDTNNYNCRWSQKRIQMAIKVIIESLKRVECRWISRQEVRDAARIYIGDTGLLDFVLKSLGNQIVGNYLVRRSLNPVKKVLEYCLEDISNQSLPSHHHHHHELVTTQSTPLMVATVKNNNGYYNCKVTRAQVMKDIIHLYKYILMDNKGVLSSIGILNTIPMASRVILDAKYFIKEYYDTEIIIPTRTRSFDNMDFDQDEERLKLFCTLLVKTNKGDHDYHEEESIPPYECIIIKKNATFHDLYKEVERVFKEIYWKLRDVEVESVVGLRMMRIDEIVMREVEDGRRIVFEGMRKEEVVMVKEAIGGTKIMECGCGAKQEDGERMVCCDICEVWQHTRCVNIPNNEEVPHIFVCKRCDQEILPLSTLP